MENECLNCYDGEIGVAKEGEKATTGQDGREDSMICMMVAKKKGKIFQGVKGLVKR